MQIQGLASIPSLAYQDYPLNITLRIYSSGSRYGMDILSAESPPMRVPINMSRNDLASLTQRLQQDMRQIARFISKRASVLTSAEEEELFLPLAEKGHLAFKRVFADPDASTLIKELIELGGRVTFQVASEDFFFPWECIYSNGLNEPLAVENFWGMKYTIQRAIVQGRRPGAFVRPFIRVASAPTIGLLTYLKLHGVKEKEIPFFDKLAEDGKIALFKLRELNPDKKRQEFAHFRHFWTKHLQLAHLACHAEYDKDFPDLSSIRLSNEFLVSLQDMEVYGITINGNPLIILNACETGQMNPLYTSHFAGAFLKYGARGVVATECAVPDSFAADFTEQLYTRLLAGEPLGESLLQVRQHFWQQERNPSGLLYAMYAPPSIRLLYS